ncbi:MAG: hypothetical protein K8I27_10510 [Planctomycetes bacterium]|nr:hypothetical protein [Planctomycetota bacterium]
MNNDTIRGAGRQTWSPVRKRRAPTDTVPGIAPLLAAALCFTLAACTTDDPTPGKSGGGGAPAGDVVTNRIDIPPAVVRNLGITFAKAERRKVDRTLRMPGAFESPPEAERNYRTPVSGRVDLKIAQYDRVAVGDEIAVMDSPEWRVMQNELDGLDSELAARRSELVQAQAQCDQAQESVKFYPQRIAGYDPQLKAITAHIEKLTVARDLWRERVTELEELVAKGAGRSADLTAARSEAAGAEAALSEEQEKRAELERARTDLEIESQLASITIPALESAVKAAQGRVDAAQRSFDLKLRSGAAQIDLSLEALANDAWRRLDAITMKATAPGVVMDLHVTNGELLEGGDSLCHVLDDSRIRFRARGLQSDLGKLRNGLNGRVVPPVGGTLADAEHASGTITLAPGADADSRLVDVLLVPQEAPEWARPGVSGELEIVWDEGAGDELAVPNRALIRDGLDTVMFVRDRTDSNKVIRTVVETGATDGRWTVVYQGVMAGSEVVVEGTYELKLTGGGKTNVEGHFHADGTFHAGKHSEDE